MYSPIEKTLYWLVALAVVAGLVATTAGCTEPEEDGVVRVNLLLESIVGADMCPLQDDPNPVPLTVDMDRDVIVELADSEDQDWTCQWVYPGVECFAFAFGGDGPPMRVWVDVGHQRASFTWASSCVLYYRVEIVEWL